MWDQMIEVDLRSAFLCSPCGSPHMQQQRFGRIINVASQLGKKGGPASLTTAPPKPVSSGSPGHWPAKVGKHGITANCIAPGPIETLADGLSDEWIETVLDSSRDPRTPSDP